MVSFEPSSEDGFEQDAVWTNADGTTSRLPVTAAAARDIINGVKG